MEGMIFCFTPVNNFQSLLKQVLLQKQRAVNYLLILRTGLFDTKKNPS